MSFVGQKMLKRATEDSYAAPNREHQVWLNGLREGQSYGYKIALEEKEREKEFIYSKVTLTAAAIASTIVMVMVVLKYNEYVDWPWYIVLMPIWVLFLFTILLLPISILYLIYWNVSNPEKVH